MMSSVFCLLLLVLATSAKPPWKEAEKFINAENCGSSEFPASASRVVGGEKSTHGSWPWQISLRLQVNPNDQRHICGGTIIADQWILSAAHCFMMTTGKDQETAYYKVRVGEHRQDHRDGTEVDHPVEKIIRHVGYDESTPTSPHDIALVKLSTKITMTEYVRPVCLNDVQKQFDDTEGCWITGWGETLGTEDSNHLQQLQGKVWKNRKCRRGWSKGADGWGRYIKSGMVCFGHGDKGACMGDSGGPLVCKKSGSNKFLQVGVTSWGHGSCNVYGMPSVYTRVSSYIAWINDNMV